MGTLRRAPHPGVTEGFLQEVLSEFNLTMSRIYKARGGEGCSRQKTGVIRGLGTEGTVGLPGGCGRRAAPGGHGGSFSGDLGLGMAREANRCERGQHKAKAG